MCESRGQCGHPRREVVVSGVERGLRPVRDRVDLKTDVYQAIYQVMVGDEVLPARKAGRRRFVLGQAANLGIIDLRPRTPVLTAATHEAFL